MAGVTSPVAQPSSGGVTGPQATYAQYIGQEQKVKNAGQLAASGMGGASTALPQENTGANVLTAQTLMSQSDADAAAQAQAQLASKAGAATNRNNLLGGIGGLLGGL